jgi:hypothetical protein
MLIKNKDNQVEIIGTWEKETNKETTLTVKVNDNIIFQKDITSNEYINITHELENGENDITIVESYNNFTLNTINQKITLNNEKTPVEQSEQQVAHESTQTTIQMPAFEKTGTNEGINFFAGLIVTTLLIIAICFISKKLKNKKGEQ